MLKQNDKISVVVPVYNTDKYLHKCISSILKQSYDNYEIILIDDGSTDYSGDICDDYANKYEKITVYHKQNEGLSAARNDGIRYATGEFITFVDSDDYLHYQALEILATGCVKNEADICIGGLKYINENDVLKNGKYNISFTKYRIVTKNNLMDYYLKTDQGHSTVISANNKLYRRALFMGIMYPCGRYFEDMYVSFEIFDRAEKICICDKYTYYYIQRQGSICQSELTKCKKEDLFCGQKIIFDFFKKNGHKRQIQRYAYEMMKYGAYQYISDNSWQNKIFYYKYYHVFLPYVRELSEKVSFSGLLINTMVYDTFWKWIEWYWKRKK